MFRCFQNLKGAVLLAAVTVVAIYLVFWHGAHLVGLAPFLLLLACPLMHVFGHGGHGGHGHHARHRLDPDQTTQPGTGTEREGAHEKH